MLARPHWAPTGAVGAKTWALALGYLAAYLALDWASYIRPLQGLNITPWNPQAALAIAFLMWDRRWLGLVFAGLLAAEVVVRGWPAHWLAAGSAALGLSLTYAAISRALARHIDSSQPFATRRDLSWFAAIVVGGSLISAVVYVLAFSAAGFGRQDSVYGAIVRFWIGDSVGLAVTLPILLIGAGRAGRAALFTVMRSWPSWIAAASTCAGLWIIFGRSEADYFKYFYVLLLPVVWASAHYGVAGAVLSSAFTQVGLIVATQIALPRDLTVFELQTLLAASTMTALLLGVLVDERAHTATELRRSLRFAAAGQMAAALAHELSQPLTALSNYAKACQTLAAFPPSPAVAGQLAQVAQRVVSESQRAGEIVRRLRDFFASGATTLRRVPVAAMLNEALSAHSAFAERLGVALSAEIAPQLPPVWVDSIQIAVVLRNLVANAVESAAASSAGKHAVIGARLERARVLVSVHDSGNGVETARLHSIFDALPSAKPGGLGVGLSICRAIVEAHGGALWAEPGPGGHFFFTLPIDDHASTPADAR
jgi:signal transduction histidine kinase